jgi:hypothetical protein
MGNILLQGPQGYSISYSTWIRHIGYEQGSPTLNLESYWGCRLLFQPSRLRWENTTISRLFVLLVSWYWAGTKASNFPGPWVREMFKTKT